MLVATIAGCVALLTVAGAAVARPDAGAGHHNVTRPAAGSPINVAVINDLTGVFAANGQSQATGINLGLHDFGSHVAGHAIHLKYYDAQSDPSVAVTMAREAVQTFHADVIFGPSAANENGAVSPVVAGLGVPMDDHSLCSSTQFPLHENPAIPIYSSAWSCDTPSFLAAEWAYKTMHWHHMTLVGQDYAFGWLTTGAFATEYERLGGKIDKYIWIPITATDYSPYISSISTSTQGVFTEMAGAASVRFVDAYQQFGLKGKVPLVGTLTLTDNAVLSSETPAAALGTYMVGHFCDGIDNPVNKTFQKEYYADYHTYAGYYAEAGYTKVRILINALKRVHGDVSNRAAFAKALMDVNIEAPRGPLRMDAQYKAPIENVYVCQVKKVDGALHNVPVETYENVPPWGPLTQKEWIAEFTHDTAGRPG